MSAIKTHISKLYYVTLVVPDDVEQHISASDANQKAWELKVLGATQGHVEAGSNHYSKLEEWASFHTYDATLLAESRLIHAVWDTRKEMKDDPARP